jgi:hypothetical protein
VLLNQIGGKQFLEAFESLKGGGQITQIEGDKATQAIARMSRAQTEPEFRAAVKEFKDIVKIGMERAASKAGSPDSPAPRTVVRTGVDKATGRKVVQYSDGSIDYAD